jgi:hypothetical protein
VKLTKQNIIYSYSYSKSRSLKAFKHNRYEQSLNFIKIAAQIANNFNWIYYDDDLEKQLKIISTILLKPTNNYKISEVNRIVFYDSFSWDNKGLTQQYIRAFMSFNWEILYITESSHENKISKNIFNELKSYDKSEIFEVPQNIERTEQIRIIYKKIISFKSGKLFMHLSPSAVSAITAFYALPKEITKYQINLTDSSFWLGNRCLDYTLDFMPIGCIISKEKRDINDNQILLQPMYPIISKSDFEEFPEKYTKDKIIIFSGATFYKVFGDNGEFFSLVKQILDDNQNAVFLFAGTGDYFQMNNFIKKNGLEHKFILLGLRSDINEVFKHCDIYMGTYPKGGGLMSLYAAMNGKPILNYKTEEEGFEVEEVVCQIKNCKITFTDKENFFIEAKRLINNVDYRQQRGSQIRSCLNTKEQFNTSLKQTIISNKNQKKYQDIKIDFDQVFSQNVENENTIQNSHKLFIIKKFNMQTIIFFPKIFLWFVLFIFSKRGVDKILNRLKLKISNNSHKSINN